MVVIAGGFFQATAQDISDQEEVELLFNLHLLQVNNLQNNNLSSVQQVGIDNKTRSIQEHDGFLPNEIIVKQNGSGNIGYSEQTGSGHATVLLQSGVENEASIWSKGNNSLTIIEQEGNYNTVYSYIDNQGIVPKAALLQQSGNNNKIEFGLLGNGFWEDGWPKAAYIKQTGNDLEVNAIFDTYQSPVYIEQQSGIAGGMKVDVSTSSFNFPMKR